LTLLHANMLSLLTKHTAGTNSSTYSRANRGTFPATSDDSDYGSDSGSSADLGNIVFG
jgi:hypothetical protein